MAKQQMWENGSIDVNISQDDLYAFFLDQAWDSLSKSYVYSKNGSPVTFFLELMEVDLVGSVQY